MTVFQFIYVQIGVCKHVHEKRVKIKKLFTEYFACTFFEFYYVF